MHDTINMVPGLKAGRTPTNDWHLLDRPLSMNHEARRQDRVWRSRGRRVSSLGAVFGAHPNQQARQQQQHHPESAAAAAATPRSSIETARTLSQSSSGSVPWREPSGVGREGVAGEMEGGSSGGGRREIRNNLSLSEFPQLAFLAQVRGTRREDKRSREGGGCFFDAVLAGVVSCIFMCFLFV